MVQPGLNRWLAGYWQVDREVKEKASAGSRAVKRGGSRPHWPPNPMRESLRL